MVGIATVLIPLMLFSIWLFWWVQPKEVRYSALRRYNFAAIAAAVLAAAAVTLYFWSTTGQSVDHAWWPVLAGVGSIFVISLVLLLGAVVRAVVFRGSHGR